MKLFTIGVYGLTSQDFFDKLLSNKIDLFVDIRQRRAVRGSKYSFVNSTALQNKLKAIGINYIHLVELAPTADIREFQKTDDLKKQIKKSERQELGRVFIDEYSRQILDRYNFSTFFKRVEDFKAENAVLFCVEKFPGACHRSLVANRIQQEFNIPIQHL